MNNNFDKGDIEICSAPNDGNVAMNSDGDIIPIDDAVSNPDEDLTGYADADYENQQEAVLGYRLSQELQRSDPFSGKDALSKLAIKAVGASSDDEPIGWLESYQFESDQEDNNLSDEDRYVYSIGEVQAAQNRVNEAKYFLNNDSEIVAERQAREDYYDNDRNNPIAPAISAKEKSAELKLRLAEDSFEKTIAKWRERYSNPSWPKN